MLASLGDAVILTDETDHITFFNQAAEELIGVPEAQALQRTCAEVFAANARDCRHGGAHAHLGPEPVVRRGGPAGRAAARPGAPELLADLGPTATCTASRW